MKGRFLVTFFLLIISQMNSSPIMVQEIQIEGISNQTPQNDVSSSDFRKIGYYTNSSSEYANALFPLLRYNSFGPFLQQFDDLTNLANFSMVIVPFKLNWSINEINSLQVFISSGGIAYLTKHVPSELLDVTIGDAEGYYIKPTSLSYVVGNKYLNTVYINYYKAFKSLTGTYYPFEDSRNLDFIVSSNDNYEVMHFASNISTGANNLGDVTVTKKIGEGRLTFTAASLFDVLGQRAMGGPIVDHTIVGTRGSDGQNNMLINYIIKKQLMMESNFIPYLWHTPYAKLGVFMSRDDVDSYTSAAVSTRGKVDRKNNVRSIFYELRDDIPEADWDAVLDRDPVTNETYHIPGYHRHTRYEYTAASYLARVLDIEKETGLNMYFECHHGAGSGFFAQDYVRTAVEATNNLTHPVVYTSSEGGHGNLYVEPYLYRNQNGDIETAKNYYSFPKSITIDTIVNRNYVNTFNNYAVNNLFYYSDHIHYLLHSQNVKTTMDTNYDNILSSTTNKILPYLYTDPVNYLLQTLNHAINVTSSYKITAESVNIALEVTNDVYGYSFTLPLEETKIISEILLDNVAIDLNSMIYRLDSDGYHVLFYTNMTVGSHELVINYSSNTLEFADDLDGDFIQDKFEPFLNTDPIKADTDGDSVSDGFEMFKIGSDPNNEDSDADGMPDGWEFNYGLNPLSNDAQLDMDLDGVINLDEYLYGFDPQLKDTDGDGIDDFDELYELTYTPTTSDTDISSDITSETSIDTTDDHFNPSTSGSTVESLFLFSPLMLISVFFYLKKRKSNIK